MVTGVISPLLIGVITSYLKLDPGPVTWYHWTHLLNVFETKSAHNAKLTWTNIPIGVWYVYLQLVDSFGTCRQLYHTLVLWDVNIYSILKMYSIFADSINETTSPCKIGHFIQPILTLRLHRFCHLLHRFFFAKCKMQPRQQRQNSSQKRSIQANRNALVPGWTREQMSHEKNTGPETFHEIWVVKFCM